MKKLSLFLFIVAFSLLILPILVAQDNSSKRKSNFNIENGVAIGGYDPVAYFDGKPTEGKKTLKYAYKWHTAIYLGSDCIGSVRDSCLFEEKKNSYS